MARATCRTTDTRKAGGQLDGVDYEQLAPKVMRAGKFTQDVPRVVGPLRLRNHQAVADFRFLRGYTRRPIKMTLPGPSTLVDGTVDQQYGDQPALALAYAAVLNEGVHVCYGYRARLKDKEWTHGYQEIFPHLARAQVQQYSLELAEPSLEPAILAGLPGKTIQLGVIDVGTDEVERPETVASRLRAALQIVPAERLVAAPDCGMVARDRRAARRKLRSLVLGAEIVRQELAGY